MSDLISQAENALLRPADLTPDAVASVLGTLVAAPGVDAADLYFQHQISESWVLEDGIVKDGSFHVDQGVGVRALSGEKTGFAYSNDIRLAALSQAAGAARSIARAGQTGTVQAWKRPAFTSLYVADNPLEVMAQADKVAFLQRIDAYTRSLDSRITQVSVSMSGVHDTIMVAASDGTWAGDIRSMLALSLNTTVVASAVAQVVVDAPITAILKQKSALWHTPEKRCDRLTSICRRLLHRRVVCRW